MSVSYRLFFNLDYNDTLQFYIPKPYISKTDNDKLGYVSKAANATTMASLGLESNETSTALLDLCEKINPNYLTKKYNAKHKKPLPLEELLTQDRSKKIIQQFVSVTLSKFFALAIENEMPITLGLDKTNIVENQRLRYAKQQLTPKFYFYKSDYGLEYKLGLVYQAEEILPHKHEIEILLDNPPYVAIDKHIYTLASINANKIKPFIKNDTVVIPQRNSVEYFNKFIKKIINKVDVIADGFDVLTDSQCQYCIVRNTKTILSEINFIELFFVYKNRTFSIVDSAEKHIIIDHDNDGNFVVYETKRDYKKEQQYVAFFKNIGLSFLDNGLGTFKPQEKDLPIYYNISKLIEQKSKIIAEGIKIDLRHGGGAINLYKPEITTRKTETNDWFDVNMTIKIDEFEIPFVSLTNHLKTGARFYELPDKTCFLIPEAWYSTFQSLLAVGKQNKNAITVQKKHYPLLIDLGILEERELKADAVSFVPTKNLKASLRPYQKEGANWLLQNYQLSHGSCLADDMGLGKTLQTLAFLDFVFANFKDHFVSNSESFPVDLFSAPRVDNGVLGALVVSPSSLTFNWNNESEKFCPHFSRLNYVGSKRSQQKKKIPETDIVFTSFGILLREKDYFSQQNFNFLIIDESQQIKNRNAQIFKAISGLNAKHIISLSGTPIENSLSDLWSQMQVINPNLLGNYSFFNETFKKPIEIHSNEEKSNLLRQLIKPFVLRRTKANVAKDLPEVSEQLFLTKLAKKQEKIYEEEKSRVRNYIIAQKTKTNHTKQQYKISILNQLLKLRQIANHPILIQQNESSGKFNDVTAYLETLIRAKQKVLIFSSFTSHLNIYTEWCEKNKTSYYLLTGNTPVPDRATQVDAFNNTNETLLFFISLKAGGTGLNLTAASYVIILDPWWNPFAELQAIGRAHRIGQLQKVNVVRFIAKNTIEEKISQLQNAKKVLASGILEANENEDILDNLDYVLS